MLHKNILLAKNTPEPGNPVASYRDQILRRLLENKDGINIDEMIHYLNISRTAVQNHFQALEKQGLIRKNNRIKTMGRPSINYVLTDQGMAYFPKRYALFSQLLLQELKNEMGSGQLVAFLQKLGKKLASQYQSHFADLSDNERAEALLVLLKELGFHASLQQDAASSAVEIRANNCIYHDVAQQFHEICALDISLVEALANRPVELRSCMAKGDGECCFRIRAAHKVTKPN